MTAPGVGTVAVVGSGRLGTALADALAATGRAVTGPHGRGYDGAGADVVLLCVPDGAIAHAAEAVRPGPLVGHCSGATRLDALGDREAFSLHPLMTVTAAGARFGGVPAAIAGTSPRALAVARMLADAVGLRPIEIAEDDRAAYHAAASIAANFLITVEAAAARLMATAGHPPEVLLPLARAALDNWARGGVAALTGPVARGDTDTVQRQRAAVADRAPELLELFDALVAATRGMLPGGVEPRDGDTAG